MNKVETTKVELFDIIRQQAVLQTELQRLEQIKQNKMVELEKAEREVQTPKSVLA